MKCYLLWRDNQESGPHTTEYLRALGLQAFDLLKPPGCLHCWSYPSQIEELKPFVRSSSSNSSQTQKIPVSNWLSGGIFFVIASMIWVKGLINRSDIRTAGAMHSVSGQVRGLPEDAIPERSIDETYQNALTIEIIPVDTSQDGITAGKNISSAELRKKVHLKGATQKAGVYGEFKDLQLSVYNTSPLLLERVVIKVEFTRLGGKSIKAERYVLYDLLPKGKRTLTIPMGKKDIKAKYEIMDVKPKEYKAVLVLT